MLRKGKLLQGWVYGLKLHVIMSDRGEIISFVVTPANTSDANIDLLKNISRKVWGDLVGDKGYIGKNKLYHAMNIHFICKYRKNMLQSPLP